MFAIGKETFMLSIVFIKIDPNNLSKIILVTYIWILIIEYTETFFLF